MLFLSVIIPTYNRNDKLTVCLKKLAPGVQTGIETVRYEVIVTDDSENNAAKSLIETQFPWVKWIKGPGKGPAANRNNGSSAANGQWLVFTDDDCIPALNWLSEYVNAIKQHATCQAFEGAILPDNWETLKNDMAECPINIAGGCFWSANIMLSKEIFWRVKGFNDQFTIAANEDQELYLKVVGYTEVRFIKTCIVIHPVKHVSLAHKLRMLGKFEFSQVLLRYHQQFSGWANWIDGMRIHLLAGIHHLKKLKPKSFCYHIAGFFYRLFISPFVIHNLYVDKPFNKSAEN